MEFKLNVDNLKDLINSAGLTVTEAARCIGRHESITRQKLRGERTLFLDEVDAMAEAITAAGRIEVTRDQLLELLGRGRVKVRGYVD